MMAKMLLEEYMKKYPLDYSAYPYYASILITLGDFNEAEKVLDYVEIISNANENFTSKETKVQNLKYNILFSKLKLLSYQEKYDELYKIYLNNSQELYDINLNHNIIFYCKKKLGMLSLNSINTNSYILSQITNYDESLFLEHIKKHLADYNKDINEPNKNIFAYDFPIDKVLSEVKKHICSSKKLYPGFFEDLYTFKYNECGRDNNKITDYFKVICFHNTNDFITMLPVTEGENLPYIDLNYMIPENTPKTKIKSQIDKFNQRYKRN